MILKDDLKSINKEDLESLIENEIQEDNTLEYKRDNPLDSREGKQKFLEAISSFANSNGGDLIIGLEVDSESKLPKRLVGIATPSIDETIRGLDDIIRQGIQLRLSDYSVSTIPLDGSYYAIIYRIRKSWIGPHRVILYGLDKFFSRGAAGKYPMDVFQLKSAFLMSQTRVDMIKSFISERISHIYINNMPVPIRKGPKVILHVIPFNAFDPENSLNLQENERFITQLMTLDNRYGILKYNIDGIIKIDESPSNKDNFAYIQFYRNGIIESVEGKFLIDEDAKCIPLVKFEENLIKSVDNYLKVLKDLNINPPILVQISIANIKNCSRCISSHFSGEKPTEIHKDIIQLPEAIIQNYDIMGEMVLHNALDALSNACGLPKSSNYDDKGHWKRP
jgi:hypothetical protein